MGFHQRDLRRLKQMHKQKNTITAQRRGAIRAGGRNTRKSSELTQQRVAGLQLQHETQTDAAGRPTGGGWADVVQTALVKLGMEEEPPLVPTRLHLQPPPCSPPPAASTLQQSD